MGLRGTLRERGEQFLGNGEELDEEAVPAPPSDSGMLAAAEALAVLPPAFAEELSGPLGDGPAVAVVEEALPAAVLAVP
ncbi:hypothetical protein V5O48_019704, partial [Marasmius crinis-equi]